MDSEKVPRFDNSPNLFGSGGQSSQHALSCAWCGVVHNADFPFDDSGAEGLGEVEGEESVCFTHFGDKQICICCFGIIEQAVLARMPDIIPWFIRIIKAREKHTQGMKDIIIQLQSVLDSDSEKR